MTEKEVKILPATHGMAKMLSQASREELHRDKIMKGIRKEGKENKEKRKKKTRGHILFLFHMQSRLAYGWSLDKAVVAAKPAL